MNVLILHAHPEPKSFTSALKDITIKHFTDKGDNVVVNDLYGMKFNPVGFDIDFKERANNEYFHYLKEQMNAHLNNSYADELKLEMDKLINADLIIPIFPLWWSSMPAILKGWFDRVLAFGFAYHPKDKKYDTGAFKDKKAFCVITAGGSQEAYSSGGENGNIDDVIYHINHGTLYYCGMKVLPAFITWRTHLSPPEVLNKYIEEYIAFLNDIDNKKPIY